MNFLPDWKILQDCRIVVGVTGGIAAYKTCEAIRLLIRSGAQVRVVMTAAAQKFITPLTFETLSGEEVVTELFPANKTVKTRHVHLADWAHAILVCPATANIVGKMAAGIADDFLTTLLMATRSPVVMAPAMDYQMIANSIFLNNCERLKQFGVRFVSSEEGELASGARGYGRLADPQRILDAVIFAVRCGISLKGKKVLVTAGPTRESIDPVRFITNHSSGKMGFACAHAAALRGAEVTVITGPSALSASDGIRVERVNTALQMKEAVLREAEKNDILIMTAAVSDYRPVEIHPHKLKKSAERIHLELEKTDDILLGLKRKKLRLLVAGFAVETENEEQGALAKMAEKSLDIICLNNPLNPGSGFGTDTNRVTIFDRHGGKNELPLVSKWAVAESLLDAIETLLEEKTHG